MADLLYADAMQPLKVALLGSLADGVIDLLAEILLWSAPSMRQTVHPPHVYTSTSSVPPVRSDSEMLSKHHQTQII